MGCWDAATLPHAVDGGTSGSSSRCGFHLRDLVGSSCTENSSLRCLREGGSLADSVSGSGRSKVEGDIISWATFEASSGTSKWQKRETITGASRVASRVYCIIVFSGVTG